MKTKSISLSTQEANLLQVSLTHMKEHLEQISEEVETIEKINICNKLLEDLK